MSYPETNMSVENNVKLYKDIIRPIMVYKPGPSKNLLKQSNFWNGQAKNNHRKTILTYIHNEDVRQQ